jgi:hypothetical protein
MWRRAVAGLGLCGMMLAGCDGDGEGGPGQDPGILDRLSFPSTLIFGPVPLKLEVVESIRIQNESVEEAVIQDIRTDGRFSSDTYAFAIESSLPLRIRPGSPTPLMFSFRATEPVTSAEARTEVTLVFSTGETAVVGLSAETSSALRVSASNLDFGEVLVGRPAEITLRITNQLDRPVPVYALTSGGRARPEVLEGIGRFEIDAAVNDDGRLANASPLAARSTVDIDVRYVPDPSAVTSDRARWRVGACPELDDDCAVDIFMEGEPLPSPILCRRSGEEALIASIAFGNLNPPETDQVTLDCQVRAPVRLVGIGRPLSGTGIEVTSSLIDPPPLRLDPGDAFTLDVAFDPSVLEPGTDVPEATAVTLELRDPQNDTPFETIEVEVSGGHGRPELEVAPSPVGFQSAAAGTRRPERVVVRNTAPIRFSGQVRIAPGVDGDPGAFESARDGATIDIEPGASETIVVNFTPNLPAGPKSSQLILETTENSDPRNPNFAREIPLEGVAEDLPECEVFVSTSEVDFGRSVPLTENRAYVAITNLDSELCLINGIRLAPGTDPEIRLVDPPDEIRLARDESALVELAYATNRPSDAEELAAEGTLEFYVSSEPSFRTLPISGEQSLIDVVRAPNVVDLRAGDPACGSYVKPVSILNGDPSELTIQSIEVTGEDALAFEVELDEMLPVTIPDRRGRFTFDVKLTPSLADETLLSAQVEVSLAGSGAPLVIPVLARAETGSRYVETFRQGGFSDVDLVFVRPTAPAVGALLNEASGPYTELTDPIVDAGMDYHIGFINSASSSLCFNGAASEPPAIQHRGDCGLLASGPVGVEFREEWRVIDGSEMAPSEGQVFSGLMSSQPRSGADEVLEAMYLAVHPEPVSAWNAEIHRPDALLHFVIVNNEDDASPGDLEFFADWMRYARGYPRRFDTTVTAVVGPEDGPCSNPFVTAVRAPRIADFAARVGGGANILVCDEDWGAIMEQVGRDATGLRDRVRVARAANSSSVEVRVDGTLLPPFDGPEQNWSFDSPSRVLTFRDPITQVPGTEIEVSYRPVCAGN